MVADLSVQLRQLDGREVSCRRLWRPVWRDSHRRRQHLLHHSAHRQHGPVHMDWEASRRDTMTSPAASGVVLRVLEASTCCIIAKTASVDPVLSNQRSRYTAAPERTCGDAQGLQHLGGLQGPLHIGLLAAPRARPCLWHPPLDGNAHKVATKCTWNALWSNSYQHRALPRNRQHEFAAGRAGARAHIRCHCSVLGCVRPQGGV